MILSNIKIIELYDSGQIIIDPFDMRNVKTSSYDVTLGEWFFREQKPPATRIWAAHQIRPWPILFNPYDFEHVKRVWGEPQSADKFYAFMGNDCRLYRGIDKDDRAIILEPGETILAHTNEFIGGVWDVTTNMRARSSYGRNFIEVCKCAGQGDVGYFNRWTMEITNNSRYYPLVLIVGRRIAQIIFDETYPTNGVSYNSDGKYQAGFALSKLKEDWRPGLMLPRLDRDREAIAANEC